METCSGVLDKICDIVNSDLEIGDKALKLADMLDDLDGLCCVQCRADLTDHIKKVIDLLVSVIRGEVNTITSLLSSKPEGEGLERLGFALTYSPESLRIIISAAKTDGVFCPIVWIDIVNQADIHPSSSAN